MVDVARLAIAIDTDQVNDANAKLGTLSTAATKAGKSADDLTKAGKNNSFQMRQTAMQLSQVASQGAVTGNYLQALAIQLPDLALAFGPVAIIAGALAGSLAGPLINAFKDTGDNADELSDKILKLTDNLKDATWAQAQFVRAQNAEKIRDQNKIIEEAKDRLKELSAQYAELEKRTGAIGIGATKLSNAMDEQQAIIDTAKQEIKSYSEISDVARTRDVERSEAVNKIIAGLATQAATLGMTEKQQLKYNLALANANNEEIRSAMTLQTVIDKHKEKEKILKASEASTLKRQKTAQDSFEALAKSQMDSSEKATDKFLTDQYTIASALGEGVITYEAATKAKIKSEEDFAIEKQRIQDEQISAELGVYSANLAAASDFAQNMNAALQAYGEDSSHLGQAMLAASKILMVAQAVMAAEMSAVMTRAAYASAAAFAGPGAPAVLAAGESHAQINRGLGYASAALIAATEFAPARAMGGQVQAGTTYMVNEFGSETFTPGVSGTIGKAENNNSGSITVVNQISTGVAATVQAEIMKVIPSIMKATSQAARAR